MTKNHRPHIPDHGEISDEAIKIDQVPKPELIIAEDNFSGKKHQAKKPKKRLSKKAKIIIACSIVALLLTAAGAVAFMLSRQKKVERVVTKTKATVQAKTTVPSPLTGVEVSPKLAQRPTLSVVIENLYPDARPQSGLSDAGVVYEALAEGGITRYLAIYQDGLPLEKDIGPVRSLRTYFIDWTMEYNAPVVHAGGNEDAIALIKPTGVKSLNQFYNGSYFKRVTSRWAPHNLYTTGKQLDQLLRDRGYDEKPNFAPWPRKNDDTNKAGDATNITVDFSAKDYRASFAYDVESKSYKRSLRAVADTDANSKTQLAPKNVIVMSMLTMSKINSQVLVMKTVGSGKAWIFMDGTVIEGTWQKDAREGRTKFLDAQSNEIKLNRGQTWICVLPSDRTPSYQ